MSKTRFLTFCLLLLVLASFLFEFWPLAVIGLAALGFVGRGFLAPLLGLLLDLAYGAPVGLVTYLFFPYTLLGLLTLGIRYSFGRYLLERASRDTL